MITKIRKNLVATGFGLFLAFAIIEIVLRIYNPFPFNVWGDTIALSVNRKYEITSTAPKLDAYIVHTKNSLGFRGPEPPDNLRDKFSIIAIGGSTTECFYLKDGADWPNVAAAILNDSIPDLWLNNAGLSGHSTFGHIFLMRQAISRLKPNVVLFLIGINDFGTKQQRVFDRVINPGEIITDHDWAGLFRSLILKSEAAKLALNIYRAYNAQQRQLTGTGIDFANLEQISFDQEILDAKLAHHRATYLDGYRSRILLLRAIALKNDIFPVFITQPAAYGPATDPTTGIDLGRIRHGGDINGEMQWRLLDAYNQVLRDLKNDDGLAVIDLGRKMPKDTALFYDYVHMTNAGAGSAAKIIAADLCPILARRFPDAVPNGCPAS